MVSMDMDCQVKSINSIKALRAKNYKQTKTIKKPSPEAAPTVLT